MIRLTAAEWAALRSQFVTFKPGRGQHRKYLPYAFTEQGVAMLSSVPRSDRAIELARRFAQLAQRMLGERLSQSSRADGALRPRRLNGRRIRSIRRNATGPDVHYATT
jgi:hypothetical protein